MKLINLLAFSTLISSVFSIFSKNPVISVVFLISTFLSGALYLILIGINFIGISYIIVYCGAIAVLFLFVILMLDIKLSDILETGKEYRKNIPLGISIFILLVWIIFTIIPNTFNNVPAIYYLFSYVMILFDNINYLLFCQGLVNIDYLNPAAYAVLPNIQNNNYEELVQLISIYPLDSIDYLSSGYKSLDCYSALFQDFQQIQSLGYSLYTYGAILLINLSLILLFSMFATIIISSNNKYSPNSNFDNIYSNTMKGSENSNYQPASSILPIGWLILIIICSTLFFFNYNSLFSAEPSELISYSFLFVKKKYNSWIYLIKLLRLSFLTSTVNSRLDLIIFFIITIINVVIITLFIIVWLDFYYQETILNTTGGLNSHLAWLSLIVIYLYVIFYIIISNISIKTKFILFSLIFGLLWYLLYFYLELKYPSMNSLFTYSIIITQLRVLKKNILRNMQKKYKKTTKKFFKSIIGILHIIRIVVIFFFMVQNLYNNPILGLLIIDMFTSILIFPLEILYYVLIDFILENNKVYCDSETLTFTKLNNEASEVNPKNEDFIVKIINHLYGNFIGIFNLADILSLPRNLGANNFDFKTLSYQELNRIEVFSSTVDYILAKYPHLLLEYKDAPNQEIIKAVLLASRDRPVTSHIHNSAVFMEKEVYLKTLNTPDTIHNNVAIIKEIARYRFSLETTRHYVTLNHQ